MTLHRSLFALLFAACSLALVADADAADPQPIRALLVAGGCCHDYTTQKNLIAEGLAQRAHIDVTVVQQGGTTTDTKIPLYEDPDWAAGFDVILHDECFSGVKDPAWTQRVLRPHQGGLPAVIIHCAMHCYRDGTDQWFQFCGVTSHGHGAHYGHEVLNRDATHPIMKGFGPAWMNPKGELYEISKLWPTAHPLASAKNREKGHEDVCVWTNQYGKARVFGTTLGHHNETVSSPEFLDLLTRGTLWACDRLNDEYLKATDQESIKTRLQKEQQLLAEGKFPAGFEATIFAAPPAVKYPVFVAAAPDGTLYVAVDQNGSLDRGLKRGSIYRLRDLDDDGRADEVKLFVADVDSPRGMVWDHDRLYVMHPPHLSAFIDNDADGISDEQQVLVRDIAFTFQDRPADHTSNGVTLGIDGWLYLAIGDFGFMQAEGTDGRKLQLRGGGVVRVRPDGSGLELYSRGTRNILEVAVDPLLNGFTRDNTNDGGGWDIRLHHFTGLEDHGYPRLYMNFGEEIVQPLADYRGGSGCGTLYLDEPGFPEGMGNALYTADWGREKVFRHQLTPNGATFTPTQNDFVSLTRVTDLDVDANSCLYFASWKGATFKYVGDEVGYLVRLRPMGFAPETLPDFESMDPRDLVGQLKSPSHRRRLEAQRALLRRGVEGPGILALLNLASSPETSLVTRVAAVFTLKQALGTESHGMLRQLAESKQLQPFVVRALADRWDQTTDIETKLLVDGLSADLPRTRLESAVAIARLNLKSLARDLSNLLMDADAVVIHTAVQALVRLNASEACFALLDSASPSTARVHALRVLQSLHSKEVVDGLIRRCSAENDPIRKQEMLTALCRLHFVEGEWKGNSWGTRPDTRGPYYQPEAWAETERIAAYLKETLENSPPKQAEFLIRELTRHRIRMPGVSERLIEMAKDSDEAINLVLQNVKESESLDAPTIDFLLGLAHRETLDIEHQVLAIPLLLRVATSDVVSPVLHWLAAAKEPQQDRLRDAFLRDRSLAKCTACLIEWTSQDGDASFWALAGLASASRSRRLDNEAKAAIQQTLDAIWEEGRDRKRYLEALQLAGNRDLGGKVLLALTDADPEVVELAKSIAERWKLTPEPTSAGPAIKTLEQADVLAAAMGGKGSIAHGQAVYERLQCNKCHTVKAGEPLRGPFLPNVAKTYKRNQLAESLLMPSKSIAQGFVTNVFVLDDGRAITGFVTEEGDVQVTVRDSEGREFKIPVESIEERVTQEISVMPEGLLNEVTVDDFSSLLSYLESLAE